MFLTIQTQDISTLNTQQFEIKTLNYLRLLTFPPAAINPKTCVNYAAGTCSDKDHYKDNRTVYCKEDDKGRKLTNFTKYLCLSIDIDKV